MSERLGVAVIGLDHWYSAFMILDQLVAQADLRLVGISDSNAAHLEEARQKYSPDIATTDASQILDREDVELVFSFVPTADNVEICLQSLGRGKHTICVKPPALTVRDAARISAAADDAGVIWSASEVLPRLSAKHKYLKRIIRDGVIGSPISFYHVAHGGLPQPWAGQTGDSWWLDPQKVPGGAWLDHAIYAVDQLRWTLESEVKRVSATMSNRRRTELRMEDHGVAWLALDRGFTSVIEDAWTADIGTRFDRWIGTEGSLVVDGEGVTVHKRGTVERLDVPSDSRSAVAEIASAIRGGTKLPFTNTCSVRNLSVCLSAYESARSGKHVEPD